MGTLTNSHATRSRGGTRVPFADCEIAEEAQEAALEVLRSGWVTTGRQTSAFESEFAEYVGAEHAVAVSSCTAGIELALRSLGLEPGSRVLVSTVTFCGAVHAIVHAGLQPVLVDVDPGTGMPDEYTVRRAAASCGGVEAMLVVHLAGDPTPVVALAAAAGLPLDRVVEDAAHALGSYYCGSHIGTETAATCYSFYATKNLPIGEGGMVTTADPDRADLLRRMRLHGMSADAWRRYLPGGSWQYDVRTAGLKANMSDLQAAIGRAQLRRLPQWQHRRAEIAARYDERLAQLPGLGLPHRPRPGQGVHAWHLYPVRIPPWWPARDDVITDLDAAGIGTSVHFIPIHRLGHFRKYASGAGRDMRGAEALFPSLVSLPMYPRLTDEQVDAVCLALDESRQSQLEKREA